MSYKDKKEMPLNIYYIKNINRYIDKRFNSFSDITVK